MKSLRIVFMGTPEFAVATLGSLLMNGFNVAAVVTAPDKPAGRGKKMTKSAVREFAEFSYLPVLQPVNLKEPGFVKTLSEFNADIFIVVAFRMLPEVIWKLPPMGTINLHASLLPHYRGAAPINHVIINGEETTGVTTFFINDQIDTGNLLLREEVKIYPYENAGDLHNRLMKLGARLVIKTLKGLAKNTIIPIPQSQFLKPGEKPRSAPKIFPADCNIDWSQDSERIHNLIRGLAPYPCARSLLAGAKSSSLVKIYESKPLMQNHSMPPGTVVSDGKTFLSVCCGDGSLGILSIQVEGRKRMNIDDFLRGFPVSGLNMSAIPPA
jgi:methionyl-tRNA formyltransferase